MENNTNNNGSPKPVRKIRHPALSQASFYRLCEWLRGASGGIHESRPTFVRVAFMASEQLKMHVKATDVANAADVTSLMWEPIRVPVAAKLGEKAQKRQKRDVNISTLANAVRELYAKFGEPLPDGFEDGVRTHVVSPDHFDGTDPATPASAPVASVPPKIGDKGRPPLPAPLVYAAEIGRPHVGTNGTRVASSLDGGNRVRH